MGLTRSSSGLLLRDSFSTDTIGNYNTSASGLSVSGGTLRHSTYTRYAIHKTAYGVGCASCRAKRTVNWGGGLFLMQNADPSVVVDRDGYNAFISAGYFYVRRFDDGVETQLGAISDTNIWADGNWGYMRLYLTAAGEELRYGETSLSNLMARTDTTYTTKAYGGATITGNADGTYEEDDLDLRTSHIVTCTGLTSGYKFQVSDGTTTATATESGGTATVDASAVLFPFTQVRVLTGADAEVVVVTSATYTDMGGGDAFAYSADAATIGLRIRRLVG